MKLNRIIIVLLLFTAMTISVSKTYAQRSFSYSEPHNSFQKAIELYEKRNYNSAQNIFDNLAKTSSGYVSSFSNFYAASCAAKLNRPDAILRLETFLQIYPEHSKVNLAWFELANLYIESSQFRKAANAYDRVDKYSLSEEENEEYMFKHSYAYLKSDRPDKAKNNFLIISNKPGQYQYPATFYYAYSNYLEGDYETALTYFDKISTHQTFGGPTQYFLIQIYSLQGNYDEVISRAPKVINNSKDNKNIEMLRMLADAYFKKNQFDDALQTYQKIDNILPYEYSEIENYQIGYCLSKNNSHNKAIEYFQKATKNEGELAQSAYFGLGESYVKTNQKHFALSSFKSAYQNKSNPKLTEESLFNYAKLSIELSYNPYNEAVNAVQEYIQNYPNSANTDQAYGYLTDLFLLTKNYKSALTSIEKIKKRSPEMELAYRKILFHRGVELYNENKFTEAIENFEKTQSGTIYNPYRAEARFWIAESYYKMQKWDESLEAYNRFFNTPGVINSENYYLANYNESYAYMKKQMYSKAINGFKKYLQNPKQNQQKITADAYVRLADCYFMTRQYSDAISNYNKAIELNSVDSDYATYQKGICYGVEGDYNTKIKTLNNFINTYQNSRYTDNVLFELGLTYNILNQDEDALRYYRKMVSDYPNSVYMKKALLKIGLIHFNRGNNTEALDILKKLSVQYSGTQESKEALESIKSIYVELNDIEGYMNFSKDIPAAQISTSEQDSLTYLVGEKFYMDNNCSKAIDAYKNYIKKFPDGLFLSNARYYLGDCLYKNNQTDEAIEQYKILLSYPRSRFTANSALRVARMYQQDNKPLEALENYIQLEEIATEANMINDALFGQLQCNYALENYGLCIQAAQKMLNSERVTDAQKIEAHSLMAKSALILGQKDLAKAEFINTKELSKGEKGAEASFNISQILFDENKLEECEKTIFETIEDYASYDYWVAKSFILLADVYVEKDNIFQARQTLQSIIDNYEGQDLINIAKEKLENLPNN